MPTVSLSLTGSAASKPSTLPETQSENYKPLKVERYKSTSIAVSEGEAAAARGDPDAVRAFLTSVRDSDGEIAEYLCQYPFPKILASQPRLVVEQTQSQIKLDAHFRSGAGKAGTSAIWPAPSSLRRLVIPAPRW